MEFMQRCLERLVSACLFQVGGDDSGALVVVDPYGLSIVVPPIEMQATNTGF